MSANLETDETVEKFDAAQATKLTKRAPMLFTGGPLDPDLAALASVRAELAFFTKAVLEVRADRDYLHQRMRQQAVVHEGMSELVKLHRAENDRLRARITEYEWLKGLIPGCDGDFDKAKAWLVEYARGGMNKLSGQQRESACVVGYKEQNTTTMTKYVLFCDTCGENLGNMWVSKKQGFEFAKRMLHTKWAAHVASKSPVDNLPRNAAIPAGTDESGAPHNTVPALISDPVNPNAGMKEAFPGGRWG